MDLEHANVEIPRSFANELGMTTDDEA